MRQPKLASPILQEQRLFLEMLWMSKQYGEQVGLHTKGSDYPEIRPPGAGYTCASEERQTPPQTSGSVNAC